MNRLHTLFLLSLLLAAPLHAVHAEPIGRDVPVHVAADPGAPPVTAENLLEGDRFWPFHTRLVVDWTPPGRGEPLPRIPAVLVRVESRELLRLDFGRFGRFQVPVAATDVIEQANRVRQGEIEKMAPNLLLTIGNKLLSTRGERMESLRLLRDAELDAFLCVFADVSTDRFAELAEALRGFQDRERLATVVFPQGESKDGGVWRRLRAIDWKVPFVLGRLSVPYRRSLVGDDAPLPSVMLLTLDGRLLYAGTDASELADGIEAALAGLGPPANEDPEGDR